MLSGSSSEQELEEWGLAEAGSSVQVRGAGGYKLSRVAPDQVAQRCTLLNSVVPDQVAQCCRGFQSCRVKKVLFPCACCTAVLHCSVAADQGSGMVWYGMTKVWPRYGMVASNQGTPSKRNTAT